MEIPASYVFLFLSLALRLSREGSILLAFIETVLMALFTYWAHFGPLAYVLASVAFTVVAFFETLFEYSDYSKDLREQQALSANALSKYDSAAGESPYVLTTYRTGADAGESSTPADLHGSPLMFPCILRHIRRTAFKDDFQHSYLYIGIPIGISACYSPLISIDHPSPKAVFSIRPQDQLLRGGIHMSLRQKLEEYLETQVSARLRKRVRDSDTEVE